MCIYVEYFDGNIDFVDSARLDVLITSRNTTGFRHTEGWVRVPQGPLRGQEVKNYEALETRK